MAKNCNRKSPLVCAVIILAITLSSSHVVHGGFLSDIKQSLFPTIEVTLFNDGEEPVLYMCKYSHSQNMFTLPPGGSFRFNFTQIAFPMRWCYVYVNENIQGFFWAYNVRLRCTKCFWSIMKHPYLYRGDRGRWERQKLYSPVGFNISSFVMGAT